MDYNKNKNYFENKKLMLYGSGALLVLGLVLWFGPFWGPDNHYVMYILSVLSIVLGGVIFAITLGKRSNDKKIDEQIEEAFRHFDEETDERFDLYERQLNYVTPALFEGYKYSENSMLRRDRSGVYRTDTYVKNRVCFTEGSVVFASREISLIKDETIDKSEEVPYRDIDRATLEDAETDCGKVKIKYENVRVKLKDGRELVFQAQASQSIDQMVEDINHLVEKKS